MGYPPYPDLRWGTPPPASVDCDTQSENITFPHPSDVGGKYQVVKVSPGGLLSGGKASLPPRPSPFSLTEVVGTLKPSITYSGTSFSLRPSPPCSPSPPEHPWTPRTSLGPQEALGAFRNFWQPWVFSYSEALFPLLPEHPYDLLGASGNLGSLQEPSEASGLQSDSGSLFPLLPSPPEHPWDLPGASGSLGSLHKPWVFSQCLSVPTTCSFNPHPNGGRPSI